MKRAGFAALCAGFGMSLTLPASCFAAAEDAIGTWKDTDTGATTQIYSCGGGICVKIVTPSKGREVDGHNPDPALKGRPMAGVTIMTGAVKDGTDRWKGQLYNSEDGKTYTGYIEVKSKDEVKLEGCVLAILCKTRIWHRAQ
jgi:uncharacterized protein (DUF2147 family)